VTLEIPENTELKDAQGRIPEAFTVNVVMLTADSSSDKAIIQAYEFGPEGATFDPPITLTLSYASQILPSGVSENDLMIASWDGIKWKALDSLVDTLVKTVSASIKQFGRYALMAPLMISQSTHLTCSGLLIKPDQVEMNEEVSIKVEVINTSSIDASDLVTLKINDNTFESRSVTLNGGQSQIVNFITRQSLPGVYTVDINGNTGQFVVLSAPTIETAIDTGFPETQNEPGSISLSVIWISIGSVLIVGLLVGFTLYRRGKPKKNRK
jgi:hypothetical protein